MNNSNKVKIRLADWAIRQIEAMYRDDVCLLIEHTTYKLDKDADDVTFGFYIPATNRANGLARTFIINGIGHDLFPMSWERIEEMADIKSYLTTCLSDGKILWARNDEDRQRFVSLQARLNANLQNPQHMLERAKKWLDSATEVYQDTLFEEKLYKVRENAGHLCNLLTLAVALANMRYLKHGQINQLTELAEMKKVPKDFAKLYRNVIAQTCPDVQKKLCYELLRNTKDFLCALEKPTSVKSAPDFSELANWYQEISYWWRRVYHWCDAKEPINAYMWGCSLQEEADEWGKKFGITDIDIMSAYNVNDLDSFRKQAEKVELGFRQTIEENGVKLDEYKTIDDFLSVN